MKMNETHVHGTKQLYPKLDNTLQFKLNRIREIKEFFNSEVNEREKMSKIIY